MSETTKEIYFHPSDLYHLARTWSAMPEDSILQKMLDILPLIRFKRFDVRADWEMYIIPDKELSTALGTLLTHVDDLVLFEKIKSFYWIELLEQIATRSDDAFVNMKELMLHYVATHPHLQLPILRYLVFYAEDRELEVAALKNVVCTFSNGNVQMQKFQRRDEDACAILVEVLETEWEVDLLFIAMEGIAKSNCPEKIKILEAFLFRLPLDRVRHDQEFSVLFDQTVWRLTRCIFAETSKTLLNDAYKRDSPRRNPWHPTAIKLATLMWDLFYHQRSLDLHPDRFAERCDDLVENIEGFQEMNENWFENTDPDDRAETARQIGLPSHAGQKEFKDNIENSIRSVVELLKEPLKDMYQKPTVFSEEMIYVQSLRSAHPAIRELAACVAELRGLKEKVIVKLLEDTVGLTDDEDE